MRKVKKWRYYCDHCRKVSGTPYTMRKHETGCTMNPARRCGLCDRSRVTQQSIEILIAALGNGNTDGMKRVRDVSNDCPACILAAIRQSKLGSYEDHCDEDGFCGLKDPAYSQFDFKAEVKTFWSEISDSENDNQAQFRPSAHFDF